GVDILLGGNPDGLAREKLRKQDVDITEATPEQWQASLAEAQHECKRDREIVLKAGGLKVIGTERHEARRIDNQLRGRSGRQGDPGSSLFFLSLEDELMRRFGGERVKGLMKTLRMPEDEPIQHNLISKSIQQAQIRIEGFNFDMRKRVLEYDDVVNKQREVIYKQRRQVLESQNLREQIERMIAEEIHDLVEEHWRDTRNQHEEDEDLWNPDELYRAALALFPVPPSVRPEAWKTMDAADIALDLTKGAIAVYDTLEQTIESTLNTPGVMRQIEREVMLRAIDQFWVRHLTDLDVLREGIGLVAIGQRDPLVEYQRESFGMWEEMQAQIKHHIVQTLFRIEVTQPQQQQPQGETTLGVRNTRATHASASAYAASNGGDGGSGGNGSGGNGDMRPQPVRDTAPEPERADVWSRTGRNDPCPCGSGKKYKNCHYREVQGQRSVVDQSQVKRTVSGGRRRG
ncbi:MAG: SEC-C domain-containing protein, partial [Anaerolineae bacterium]|nr:SEC-C domain-containing protein [Anaerolineae bacterium]